MNEYNIKPCPCCGATASLSRASALFDSYYVYCPECGLQTATYPYKAKAIRAWNNRTRGWYHDDDR